MTSPTTAEIVEMASRQSSATPDLLECIQMVRASTGHLQISATTEEEEKLDYRFTRLN
jgi:hypothetical protein